MKLRDRMTTRVAARMLVLLVSQAVLVVAACSERMPTGPATLVGEPTGPDTLVGEPLFDMILSDPVEAQVAGVAGGAAGSDTPSVVVYVSLPIGTAEGVSEIRITNLSSGVSESVALVDGGLDPHPVPAKAGDMLEFAVFDGQEAHVWTEEVDDVRSPTIVRTDPPRGKRDVPITYVIEVVFSEPMDPTTLVEAVRFLRDGNPVAGTLEVSPDGIHAVLTPEDPMDFATVYVVEIGEAAEDLDGENLEGQVEVEFSTESAEGATPALTIVKVSGDEQADTVMETLAEPFVVQLLDEEGAPVEGVPLRWEAPFTNQNRAYPRLTAISGMTDANGLASVEVTLGTQAGSWSIRASLVGGYPTVAFQVTALPGPAVQLRWQAYTEDVTLTGVSIKTPFSVVAVDAYGNPVAVPIEIEWSVISGGATLTPLSFPNSGAVYATPQVDGPAVIQAASPGLSAMTDTIYGAATIILTISGGDGHCEEGSFVPSEVAIPVGRSVAWAICDDGMPENWIPSADGWLWGWEHDVTFEDGVVVWPNTTEDWRPHLRQFTEPGTYRYRCTLHSTGFDDVQGEIGVVIVQ